MKELIHQYLTRYFYIKKNENGFSLYTKSNDDLFGGNLILKELIRLFCLTEKELRPIVRSWWNNNKAEEFNHFWKSKTVDPSFFSTFNLSGTGVYVTGITVTLGSAMTPDGQERTYIGADMAREPERGESLTYSGMLHTIGSMTKNRRSYSGNIDLKLPAQPIRWEHAPLYDVTPDPRDYML